MNPLEETITSAFWQESPEWDNPFAAARCRCAGYDVYGDLLPHANWTDYIYLLLQQQPPTAAQSRLLNGIAIALANPGPREHSIQAAMSAAAGGSSTAAALMAALAVGAGSHGGARELLLCMDRWQACGMNLARWRDQLGTELHGAADRDEDSLPDCWLPIAHPAGFDPHARRCATPTQQTLCQLSNLSPGQHLTWLLLQQQVLEAEATMPLSLVGVIAAAFCDLDLDPEQGEALYLWLRLPGALAHSLEQRQRGWKNYPFHGQGLKVTPNPRSDKGTTAVEQEPQGARQKRANHE